MSKNGEKEPKFEELSVEDKLGVVFEMLQEVTGKLDDMAEKQEELIEKISEMNEVGAGYSYNRYDN